MWQVKDIVTEATTENIIKELYLSLLKFKWKNKNEIKWNTKKYSVYL